MSQTKDIKLGVIGLSHGNGHPFSWSAICNGWDNEILKACISRSFERLARECRENNDENAARNNSVVANNIMNYLSVKNPEQDKLRGMTVTHIWTQEPILSESLQKGLNIPHVVSNMEQMIPDVDAILLARDDAENHYWMAEPFIKAGKPIFIDKPLAYNLKEAHQIYDMEQYPGQIFTCSSLSYANEILNPIANKDQVTHVEAHVFKNWLQYSIHVMEPIIKLFKLEEVRILDVKKTLETEIGMYRVVFKWENELTTTIHLHLKDFHPLTIKFEAGKMWNEIKFFDSFSAFKNSLEMFRDIILGKRKNNSMGTTLKVVEMIEKGTL